MHRLKTVSLFAVVSEVFFMLRHRIVARSLVLTFGFLAVVAAISAQQAKGPERIPVDEKEVKFKELKAIYQGEAVTDKKLIDAAARYYAHRLTWVELQAKTGGMRLLVRDAVDELEANTRDDRKNTEAIQYFNQALIAHLKEVLPNPRFIASMNAARVLGRMAGMGMEEAAEALAEALKDPAMNEGTKYNAAEGIAEFFKLAFPAGDAQPITFKSRQRESLCITALLAQLDRKLPASPPPTQEEIEGQRMFRRRIIKSLAVSRVPAVADAGGAIDPKGRTAQALVQVARNVRMNPALRLDEQLEAAIGIANLRTAPYKNYKVDHEYQIDVAAYHLGRFIVELARSVQNKGAGRQFPFRVFAARLGVACEGLQADTAAYLRANPKTDKAKYVTEMLKLTTPVLKAIASNADPRPDMLAQYLDTNPLDKQPLYKDDPTSVVDPAAAVELKTELPKEKAKTTGEKK